MFTLLYFNISLESSVVWKSSNTQNTIQRSIFKLWLHLQFIRQPHNITNKLRSKISIHSILQGWYIPMTYTTETHLIPACFSLHFFGTRPWEYVANTMVTVVKMPKWNASLEICQFPGSLGNLWWDWFLSPEQIDSPSSRNWIGGEKEMLYFETQCGYFVWKCVSPTLWALTSWWECIRHWQCP